jgi:hypothetical protein
MVFIYVFTLFIGQGVPIVIVGFVGYAYIGDPKQLGYKFSFSSYTYKRNPSSLF